jgi:hypothetical protein
MRSIWNNACVSLTIRPSKKNIFKIFFVAVLNSGTKTVVFMTFR